MLTYYQYNNRLDWSIFEQAKRRVLNDPELKEVAFELFDVFPITSKYCYSVLVLDKATLLHWVKTGNNLKLVSYQQYKKANQ
jgi:hypothetical protein